MVVETQMPVLRVEEVELAFGGVKALNNVSITINQGELVSIIGPNGAGKTCLANCICGFYKPQKGKVIFKGRDVTRFPVYSRTQIGIGRTFQGAQLFGGSVLDNIMTGRHLLLRPGIISSLLYFGKAQRKEIRERMYAEELIHFLDLEPVRKASAATIPFGFRKRVDLARAVATNPILLVLDEPIAGLNVEEKEDMVRFIKDVNEGRWFKGRSFLAEAANSYDLGPITIILIEHDMGVVLNISDRVIVLEQGKVIADGKPDEVRANPRVIEAYLGSQEK